MFSVVIPVYNTVQILPELIARLDAVFSRILHSPYEVIFVDDASPNPATRQMLTQLVEQFPCAVAIRLAHNRGQQVATMCGLAYSTGAFVITMDDDLQHRPEDIPLLASQSHHDLVIAQFARKQHGLIQRLGSRAKSWCDRLFLGVPADVRLSPFRLISRRVVDQAVALRAPYPFVPAFLFRVSRDAVGVAATHSARAEGVSGYGLWKLIRLSGKILLNYFGSFAIGPVQGLPEAAAGPNFKFFDCEVAEVIGATSHDAANNSAARFHHRDGTLGDDTP